MNARAPAPSAPTSEQARGIAARRLAVFVLDAVLTRRAALDEAFNDGLVRLRLDALAPRDRAFARLLAMTALRRYGSLDTLVSGFLDKPLPADAGRTHAILVVGAAQIVDLGTPAHAAISQSVEIARIDHSARRFDRLVNAVLRRVAAEGRDILATLDRTRLDTPTWLYDRWRRTYGDDTARNVAAAHAIEPPLDISVKSDADAWAERLTGLALPTASVRVREAGRVEDLPGYADGDWWVQDAAAALPVRLLGNIAGKRVADLCAAPGGKTAQLASAGAHVTAVDASAKRMRRLTENMARLKLAVETVVADAEAWCRESAADGTFDAVLLDAPCSATGTIRRHPDLVHTKSEADIARLALRQQSLLAAAADRVRPGGTLVYVTCSLEPDESETVVAGFLAGAATFARAPIDAAALGWPAAWVTAAGDLRTLPCHAFGPDPSAQGMDGFYAARLVRAG